MTELNYAGVLELAPGGLILTAVLLVWRRDLRSIVRLLAAQGVALAAIPIIVGGHSHDWEPVGVGVALLVLRGRCCRRYLPTRWAPKMRRARRLR
ncbi:putative membrane protein [Mycobacterium kansasii]|uniref:Putative membrane protein n=1 Tax=Mycobacterium kansasii TaxID=1768 RepID=A0A1V3XX90_MYCKA|nr:putative membrane protein [Mycobacterium kansasii]